MWFSNFDRNYLERSTSNVLKIKLGNELRSDMFVFEPCDATRE